MKKLLFSLLLTLGFGMSVAMASNVSIINVRDTVTRCDSYTWPRNGVNYHEDVNLSVTIGDTTYHLYLTIKHSSHFSDTAMACASYQWTRHNEMVYTESGVKVYQYSNGEHCPSADTLKLTILPEVSNPVTKVACESFEWMGNVYTATGSYQKRDTTASACRNNSLNLTINHNERDSIATTACHQYTWLTTGDDYTASGIYRDTVNLGNTCYRYSILNLTIDKGEGHADTVSECDRYTWHGQNYITSGVYDFEYPSLHTLCNSIDTLVLTLHSSQNRDTAVSVCDSLRWRGSLYTQSGNYPYFLGLTADGCTNTVTLKLTVKQSEHVVQTDRCCDSLLWKGLYRTTSDTYVYNYTAGNGCQSADTLHLTVIPTHHAFDNQVACDTFTWASNGVQYNQTGQYFNVSSDPTQSCIQDTLFLTIKRSTHNAPYVMKVCESYNWAAYHQVFDSTGQYTFNTRLNSANCPIYDTLNLTVVKHQVPVSMTICDTLDNWYGQSRRYYPPQSTDVLTHSFVSDPTMPSCFSDSVLTLTIRYSTNNHRVVDTCESYRWGYADPELDTIRTTSGTYYYRYMNAAGCASVDWVTLTIRNGNFDDTTASVCDSIRWHNTTYTVDGNYGIEYINGQGCRSIDSLHLTVRYASHDTVHRTACETYTWHDTLYNASGSYLYRYINNNPAQQHIPGCPSVDTLHLTIHHGDFTSTPDTGCYFYTWPTVTDSLFASGEYFFDYHNSYGCASADTLKLHLNTPYDTIDTVVCDGLMWHGQWYDTTGFYSTPYEIDGCFGMHFLNLRVKYSTHLVDTAIVCDAYTWNKGGRDTVLNATGYYVYNYRNAVNGCPSADTLKLTVNYSTEHTLDTVRRCESYYWPEADLTFIQSGSYQRHYTNAGGCPAVDTLPLIIVARHTVLTTTVCDSFYWDRTLATYYRDTLVEFPNHVEFCNFVDTLNLTIVNHRHVFDSVIACQNYLWHDVVYNQPGTYTHTYIDGNNCMGRDTLQLSILNHAVDTTVCDSLIWNNASYFNTGTYFPQYYNSTYGCAETDTLHLVVNHSTIHVDPVVACDSYTWAIDNNTYTQSGSYFDSIPTVQGCDSIRELRLTINHTTDTTLFAVACDSYQWALNGVTYSRSGAYADTLLNLMGCDSIITLNLTINSSRTDTIPVQTCDHYDWNGITYTTSGLYYYYDTTYQGCDSTAVLNLTLRSSHVTPLNIDACGQYVWHDQTFVSDTVVFDTLVAQNGCDSILQNNISIHPVYNANNVIVDSVFTCRSTYYWSLNGHTYTSSAQDSYMGHTVHGCDSLVALALVMGNLEAIVTDTAACNGFVWRGHHFNHDITFEDTSFVNPLCDSIFRLQLRIDHPSIFVENDTACDSFTWIDGNTYTTNMETPTVTLSTVRYTCDSVVRLSLVIRHSDNIIDNQVSCGPYPWLPGSAAISTSGDYYHTFTNRYGCDSIVHLALTVNQPSYGTYHVNACDSYTWINGQTYIQSPVAYPQYTILNADPITGCDSVVSLHLTINHRQILNDYESGCEKYLWPTSAEIYTRDTVVVRKIGTTPEGCDKLQRLNLTIRRDSYITDSVVACDQYQWPGYPDTLYTASVAGDTIAQPYPAQNGCTSFRVLKLTLHQHSDTIERLEVCDSLVWRDGYTYTTSTHNVRTYTLPTVRNQYGCDSIYHLSLDVRYHQSETMAPETDCYSHAWHGHTYTTIGSYLVSDTVRRGYDLGCDIVYFLPLTINDSSFKDIYEVACDSYQWAADGVTYNQSGRYTTLAPIPNQFGCDSLFALHLTINNSNQVTLPAVIACDSYYWYVTDSTYQHSGLYPSSGVKNVHGCDSTVLLPLTVQHPVYKDTVLPEACDHLDWRGVRYTSSTVVNDTLYSVNSCDSVIYLYHITIHPNYIAYDSITTCKSYTWPVNNQTYTSSTNTHHIATTRYGCDSLVYLTLTVGDQLYLNIDTAACQEFYWNNTNFTASQTIHYTSFSSLCDTIYNIRLTIDQPTYVDDVVEACNSYTWINGRNYTHNENRDTCHIRKVSLPCDSIVHLVLTLRHNDTVPQTLHTCGPYRWLSDSLAIVASGNYSHHFANRYGCDSLVNMSLFIHGAVSNTVDTMVCDALTWIDGVTYTETPTAQPQYTYTNGSQYHCDSIVNLNLTVKHRQVYDTFDAACNEYLFLPTHDLCHNDTIITVSNMPKAVNGCDSSMVLHLSIYRDTATTVYVDACDSLRWEDGIWYTQPITDADPSPTVIHQTIHGCDNVVSLKLSLRHSTYHTEHCEGCGSYTWRDGITYTQVPILQPLYVLPTHNSVGCDSILQLELVLRVVDSIDTAATQCDRFYWSPLDSIFTESTVVEKHDTNLGGCDSITTLNLTIYHSEYSDTLLHNDCNVFSLGGIDYFNDTLFNEVKPMMTTHQCDSVYIHKVQLRHSSNIRDTVSVCDSYNWYNVALTNSGDYMHPCGFNTEQCDSNEFLNLTVRHSSTGYETPNLCDHYHFTNAWVDTTFRQSGNYQLTFHGVNAEQCDSVLNIALLLRQNDSIIEVKHACNSFAWQGIVFTSSADTSLHYGDYNPQGCDSIRRLILTIDYHQNVSITESVCDSMQWQGRVYAQSGSYQATIPTVAGCDSNMTLNLAVRHSSYVNTKVSACDSFYWNQEQRTFYATDTVEAFHSLNQQGCDSVRYLIVNINPSTHDYLSDVACDSITYRGVTYWANARVVDTLHQVASGCDSIISMDLTINPSRMVENTHSACDTYTWVDGNTYTDSHDTLLYRTTTVFGCDSTLLLHLTINHGYLLQTSLDSCDRVRWNDQLFTENYDQHLQSTTAQGCDSLIDIHIVVRHSNQTIDSATACDDFTWHGRNFTQSCDTAQWHGINAMGCDSTSTLHLQINNSVHQQLSLQECDSVRWNDQLFTTDFDTLFSSTTAEGCDSTLDLHIVVRHGNSSQFSITACDSYYWSDADVTYTASTTASHTFNNVAGCDSIVTLMLTIHYGSDQVDQVQDCDEYTWVNGVTYTSSVSGIAYAVPQGNLYGCDSIRYLDLLLGYSNEGDTSASAYNSFFWHDSVYTTSGDFVDVVTNQTGCDSVVTLHLMVAPFIIPEIVSTDSRLIQVNHYPMNEGVGFVDYEAYRWYRNGTLIPGASLDYYHSANYQPLIGTFYVEVPGLGGQLPDWVQSNVLLLNVDGIDQADGSLHFMVSPNPALQGSNVTITTDFDAVQLYRARLVLYDLQGRVLSDQSLNQSVQNLLLDVPAGVYMLRLITSEGPVAVQKIVVR